MQTAVNRISTRSLAYVALSAALIAVCTWIAIPLPSEIAFTMQTFAVCTVAGLLGCGRGFLAVVVYLLLGFAGLPVFSGFRAGAGVLFGATGGYLIGFLFMAPCIGFFAERFGKSVFGLLAGMVLGELLLYAFGTVWFVTVYAAGTGPMGYGTALSMCVLPYLVPDAAKMALALIVIRRLRPRLAINMGDKI